MLSAVFQPETVVANTARFAVFTPTAIFGTRRAIVAVQVLPFGTEFRHASVFHSLKPDGTHFTLSAVQIQILFCAFADFRHAVIARYLVIFGAVRTAVRGAGGAVRKFIRARFAIIAVQIKSRIALYRKATGRVFGQLETGIAPFARRSQFGTFGAVCNLFAAFATRNAVPILPRRTFHFPTKSVFARIAVRVIAIQALIFIHALKTAFGATNAFCTVVIKAGFTLFFDASPFFVFFPRFIANAKPVLHNAAFARTDLTYRFVRAFIAVFYHVRAFDALIARDIFIRPTDHLFAFSVGLLNIPQLTFLALPAVDAANAASFTKAFFARLASFAVGIISRIALQARVSVLASQASLGTRQAGIAFHICPFGAFQVDALGVKRSAVHALFTAFAAVIRFDTGDASPLAVRNKRRGTVAILSFAANRATAFSVGSVSRGTTAILILIVFITARTNGTLCSRTNAAGGARTFPASAIAAQSVRAFVTFRRFPVANRTAQRNIAVAQFDAFRVLTDFARLTILRPQTSFGAKPRRRLADFSRFARDLRFAAVGDAFVFRTHLAARTRC